MSLEIVHKGCYIPIHRNIMNSSLPLFVHCLWTQPTLAVPATPAPATLSQLPLAGLLSEACPSTFCIYFLSRWPWPCLFWCKDFIILPLSNSPFAVISFHISKAWGWADQRKTTGSGGKGWARGTCMRNLSFCGSLLQNFSTRFQPIPSFSNKILADLQLH